MELYTDKAPLCLNLFSATKHKKTIKLDINITTPTKISNAKLKTE